MTHPAPLLLGVCVHAGSGMHTQRWTLHVSVSHDTDSSLNIFPKMSYYSVLELVRRQTFYYETTSVYDCTFVIKS